MSSGTDKSDHDSDQLASLDPDTETRSRSPPRGNRPHSAKLDFENTVTSSRSFQRRRLPGARRCARRAACGISPSMNSQISWHLTLAFVKFDRNRCLPRASRRRAKIPRPRRAATFDVSIQPARSSSPPSARYSSTLQRTRRQAPRGAPRPPQRACRRTPQLINDADRPGRRAVLRQFPEAGGGDHWPVKRLGRDCWRAWRQRSVRQCGRRDCSVAINRSAT